MLRRLFVLTGCAVWAALHAAESVPPAAYTLGAHDQVRILALHAPEIPRDALAIDDEGYLHLPLVGRVRAAGQTLEQLEAALREQLKEFVLEPEVAVTLVSQRNLPVSVIGSVKTPGVYQVTERKRLIEMLSLAGGLRDDAGPKLTVTRQLARGRVALPGAHDDSTGQFSVAEVDIDALTRGMNPSLNVIIEPQDVVCTPRRSGLCDWRSEEAGRLHATRERVCTRAAGPGDGRRRPGDCVHQERQDHAPEAGQFRPHGDCGEPEARDARA